MAISVDDDNGPAALATDLAPALTRLAPQPVALLGHSLGALTAVMLAAAMPDHVTELILIDMTPGVPPRRRPDGRIGLCTRRAPSSTRGPSASCSPNLTALWAELPPPPPRYSCLPE